jgi:GNAT superfamily N-acetyltransferase
LCKAETLLVTRTEPFQGDEFVLRRATPHDAATLGELAFHSKASWGYDAAFMDKARAALETSAEYLENSPVFLLERHSGDVIAFFGFKTTGDDVFLHDFFVAPEMIGRGLGARLWTLVVETAREQHYLSFLIESDPFAKGFYQHMGAQQIGQIEAAETGRLLPLLRYTVRL